MRLTTTRRLRRLALSSLATCSLAVAAAAPASAAWPCAATNSRPTTLSLINAERSAHGVRPLRLERRLSQAACRHSRDMVGNHYFAHDSRSGARFSARIARTGWMSGRGRWSVGENLAWGGGAQATPHSIVAAWMGSPGHRANLLAAKFRVIGIGIADGTPLGGEGATYTADFGS